MAETKPSLSPKALEKMRRHRQAVMISMLHARALVNASAIANGIAEIGRVNANPITH